MIRVLLVDNSPLVLVVLKRTLVPALEIKVVGTSSNGEKAMELMHFLRPEMICTGLYMPVLDGLSFVKEVLFRYLTLILLVPYSRIPVIKNKKFEECIEIINSNIPPRYLSPSEHGDYKESRLISRSPGLVSTSANSESLNTFKPLGAVLSHLSRDYGLPLVCDSGLRQA